MVCAARPIRSPHLARAAQLAPELRQVFFDYAREPTAGQAKRITREIYRCAATIRAARAFAGAAE